MPFEAIDKPFDFPKNERNILKFWDESRIFDLLREKTKGKPRWSFLDGPITANNPMGVHHAWGRTYKDAYSRFFAMNGRELRWQNGFDCQGLWVEVEVEKELKLQSKKDIENLVPGNVTASIEQFVQKCKDRVNHFARIQTDQSIRLGQWMDWDRTDADWAKSPDERKSYFTMSSENNYTIWSFLKKCFSRNLIYRGYDVMPWCGRCGVGLSEMELGEGYQLIEHRSVFVRFPLIDRPGESLLVWTTTPWTLSSNVATAVNPKLTYVKIQCKEAIYYLAKGALKFDRMKMGDKGDDDSADMGDTKSEGDSQNAENKNKKGKVAWLPGVPHLKSIEQMFKEKGGKEGYRVLGELSGADMLGWRYQGPFDDLPAQQHPFGFPEEVAKIVQQANWSENKPAQAVHQVIAWDAVGETEGTGIVHIAPGCGREDFILGKENRLPPIAPLDDNGNFVAGFGFLSGQNASKPGTADLVFDHLKKNDTLFALERYVHKYPHCWRCKTELLFRLVDEWYIRMDWRNEIVQVVDSVQFLPESLNGRAREKDWLNNMGDWMISKKRYWGLALPIWVDEKDPTQFEVIGSYEELKERAIAGWEEFDGNTPHRPWIDQIVLRNPKTGNRMLRIPDVGNPWLDAGIVAFSTMNYNRDREEWNKWYPAEFITESFPGQFRNWFYALLAMSTMMTGGKPPFRTLLGFATVRDQFGNPMHKSAGNSIEFIAAADDGYELFAEADPKISTQELQNKQLPKNALSYREELITDKEGNSKKRVYAKYQPISTDVVRWFYCRHNPANNINFGPEPTDEVRSKFILKIWNIYSFLCEYARIDRFDPAHPLIPIHERAILDQWILSDLQQLIADANKAFSRYQVMDFCLQAEAFIDEKLSNWYLRRSRRRFWKNELGQDKLAAFQTLYEVMNTLTKLIAPIVPFLAETIYQNLRLPRDPLSVHLCDYPLIESSYINPALSNQMNALLDTISLVSSARNQAKIKVRQPLQEVLVQPGNDSVIQALERFPDLLLDELNIKKVTLHGADAASLLEAKPKLQLKYAAPKLGPHIKSAQQELLQLAWEKVKADLEKGTLTLCGIALDSNDIAIEFQSPPGWIGMAGKGTQVLLKIEISPELEAEGLAREVIRLIQDLRKSADLQTQDRIGLFVETHSMKIKQAIDIHREHIANETLTSQWFTDLPSSKQFVQKEAKIDQDPLLIAIGVI